MIWLRLRMWAAWVLLGRPADVDREVERVYAEMWPKHFAYDESNKAALRKAFLGLMAKAGGRS